MCLHQGERSAKQTSPVMSSDLQLVKSGVLDLLSSTAGNQSAATQTHTLVS